MQQVAGIWLHVGWCCFHGITLLIEGCLHHPLLPCKGAMRPDIAVFLPRDGSWCHQTCPMIIVEGSDMVRIQDVLSWDPWTLLGTINLSANKVLGFNLYHLGINEAFDAVCWRPVSQQWGRRWNVLEGANILDWDTRYGMCGWSSWIWGAVVDRRLG